MQDGLNIRRIEVERGNIRPIKKGGTNRVVVGARMGIPVNEGGGGWMGVDL